jgi:hypothetical protein
LLLYDVLMSEIQCEGVNYTSGQETPRVPFKIELHAGSCWFKDLARTLDFVIGTADSAALVVNLDEVGDGHFTEMNGVWVDPEGVRIDWICDSVRVAGRSDSVRKKEFETRNNHMLMVIVEGPPLGIVD